MSAALGMSYAPKGKPAPACQEGEFVFAAVGLDHGHINGMCNGLTEAGAQLKWVYDGDPGKAAALARSSRERRWPPARPRSSTTREVQLVASATVPADHAALGMRVMRHGKDYFTDKPPLTTLGQLAKRQDRWPHETGQKYAVYYSERLHVESAVFAGQLVQEGAIGRVVQVIGLGPHRASLASRPPWFFERERYGGILCDIGSHQTEQFLYFTGNGDARVVSSRVANYAHKDHPGMEDFGDCNLAGDNGATGYFRVDWFTPDGLEHLGGRPHLPARHGRLHRAAQVRRCGHGRRGRPGLPRRRRRRAPLLGAGARSGYPFFGELVRDCLDRTERAMTQEHAFKAAELCVIAEQQAERLG